MGCLCSPGHLAICPVDKASNSEMRLALPPGCWDLKLKVGATTSRLAMNDIFKFVFTVLKKARAWGGDPKNSEDDAKHSPLKTNKTSNHFYIGLLHCRKRQKLAMVTAMRRPKGSDVEAHTYHLSTAEEDPRTALSLNPARVLQ